jgi:hypothetical protein
MKRTASLVSLLVALALASPVAIAGSCPKEMKAIDEALPRANLDAKQTEEVRKLRAEGEQHHQAGRHAESMAALGKAKGILGLN